MTASPVDPTLDRLLRHMAWANQRVIARLAELPDAALTHTEPGSEWTVAMTLDHLVVAAIAYAARLDGGAWPDDRTPPMTTGELAGLADGCAAADARLRSTAEQPDGIAEYTVEGQTRRRARSTILGQAIHHATEHRAQIAGALAANGHVGPDGIDLDELDLWSYGAAEGLGA